MRIQNHFPVPLKEAFAFSRIDFTDAKVNKVAHAILGGLSFLVANSLFVYGGIITFLSLPLYLVSLRCAVHFFQVRDYSDEKQLEIYRQKALEETFLQTLRLHGLSNVFKFNLLPKHQLEEKLQAHLTTLKPEAIALFYLEFQKVTKTNESFLKIFSVAMAQAMSAHKASVLFENPHIKAILSSDLVSSEFINAEVRYRNFKQTRKEKCDLFENQFSENFLRNLELFENHVATAVSEDKGAQRWLYQMRQEIPKLKKMKCAAEALPENFPILQPCSGEWSDIQFVTTSHQTLLATFYNEREKYQSNIAKDLKDFDQAVATIDNNFEKGDFFPKKFSWIFPISNNEIKS